MNNTETPTIESACYDAGIVTVKVSGGEALASATASFEARSLPFLAKATDEQLTQIQVLQEGHLLRFPQLDVELPVARLLERVFGLTDIKRGAALMGAKGGAKGGTARTSAKSAAARANGAKGGRPRKRIAEGLS